VPDLFAQKVVPLFRRGDYDVAVFQAFKEVEVAVRKAANAKKAGYPDSDVGTALMRKAFHPETGPLTDMAVVRAEREAVMHLFSGAIGHAKNPMSHREWRSLRKRLRGLSSSPAIFSILLSNWPNIPRIVETNNPTYVG
jgi:uncharacterized protein (TIGR02391 family)